MARGQRESQTGFSLVELLVAVFFIGLLMAGMAKVFKSSVSTLATSSEGISSARRNRMSIDLLYDDLNAAGLYITNLSAPPQLSSTNPAFYILPNMAVAGAAADDPQTADQLYFYLDQPLPFEGSLAGTGGGAGGYTANSSSQLVMNGGAPTAGVDNSIFVDCKGASYAGMVQAGNYVIIKDYWQTFLVTGVQPPIGNTVQVTLGPDPSTAITGVGASGSTSNIQHIQNSDVLFYLPAQMVCYSVQMKLYDPQKATGTPCLVRDQGTYSSAGFVAIPALQSIVAENVAGFKVYLSANSGQAWAGLNAAYTGFTGGWTNGILNDLNTQLATAGRPGYTSTLSDSQGWFRDIPTLVRMDITTRTAMKRSEYSATGATVAYKNFTQSLVIVPRHSGLTMN